MLHRAVCRIALSLVVALALGSVVGCTARPTTAPLPPGVYADLWPSEGRIPDTGEPSEMRFSNVDGPEPPVVIAAPDSSTAIRVDGQLATWDDFKRAAGESHAIGVVVESDGTVAVLDARGELKPGDVISARRVK